MYTSKEEMKICKEEMKICEEEIKMGDFLAIVFAPKGYSLPDATSLKYEPRHEKTCLWGL